MAKILTREEAWELLKEYNKERGCNHYEGVELSKPRHHYCSKALTACCGGVYRSVETAYNKEARKSAKSARNDHRSYNDLGNVDTDVACGVLALAYDRYLVSLLTVIKVKIHYHGKEGN